MSSKTLRNGAQFPMRGLGTWQSKAGEVKAAVKHFVRAGGRHIDGAAAYGNEAEIGDAVAELIAEGVCRRDDIFITSKLWITAARPSDAAAALAKTLADLRTDFVDLYLIHWPFSIPKDSEFPPPQANIAMYTADAYLALWRALEAEVDAGRVRALGCSNMSISKMEALEAHARHPICVNQVECEHDAQQQSAAHTPARESLTPRRSNASCRPPISPAK
jgi:alcohol dehydrogenase (NADP+)